MLFMFVDEKQLNNKNNIDIEKFTEQLLKFVKTCPSVNNHNFLELMALRANKKKVVRLVVTNDTYPSVKEFCILTGLFQIHSEKKQMSLVNTVLGDIFTVSVDWDDPKGDFFVVVIGRREEDVQMALEYENKNVSFKQFGRLYGYPSCCIEGYSNIENGEDWIVNYLKQSPINIPGYYQCNRLAVLFDENTLLPEFFPCHIACKQTRELGKQYEELLRNAGWEQRLQKIRKSLKSPILIRHGTLLQLVNSRTCKNLVKYKPLMDWQINWRGQLTVDDPFYQADSLKISTGKLQFLSRDKVISEEPIDAVNNRILLFN